MYLAFEHFHSTEITDILQVRTKTGQVKQLLVGFLGFMATAAHFIPLTLYALLDIMACRLYNRAINDQIFYRSSGKILLDDSNEKNQAKEHERPPVSVRCPQVIERLAKIDCLFVDKEGTFETDRRLVRSIVIDGHEWVSQWREQADVDYEATIEEFSEDQVKMIKGLFDED